MPKILVTDLFGTLVPENFEQAHYLYGNGKKLSLWEICSNKEYLKYLLEKVSEQSLNNLNEFLDEGNVAVIVCNLGAHDLSLMNILNELVERFHKYSSNQFFVFFIKDDGPGRTDVDELSSKSSNKYVENGINYFNYNGDTIGILNKKEEVFDVIKTKYNLEDYELFSIGNKDDDIPMLVKCIKLGGRGTLLNYELYIDEEINEKTLDDAISFKIKIEYELLTEQELLEENPNFSEMSSEEQAKLKKKYLYGGNLMNYLKALREYKEKRLSEIYSELNQRKLNLEELIKKNLIFKTFYNGMIWDLENQTLTENNWDKIDMYSTFRDYYNKVLSSDVIKENDASQFKKTYKPHKED